MTILKEDPAWVEKMIAQRMATVNWTLEARRFCSKHHIDPEKFIRAIIIEGHRHHLGWCDNSEVYISGGGDFKKAPLIGEVNSILIGVEVVRRVTQVTVTMQTPIEQEIFPRIGRINLQRNCPGGKSAALEEAIKQAMSKAWALNWLDDFLVSLLGHSNRIFKLKVKPGRLVTINPLMKAYVCQVRERIFAFIWYDHPGQQFDCNNSVSVWCDLLRDALLIWPYGLQTTKISMMLDHHTFSQAHVNLLAAYPSFLPGADPKMLGLGQGDNALADDLTSKCRLLPASS